ncbi:MAG: Rieske 2Fe-2S domain-containing protein [Caldilineaceae bacterium]|nr:Rieske 2Fe-2S domain-containing protein [Caldilineaceae bacterium]
MTAQPDLQHRRNWPEGSKSATAGAALSALEHSGSLVGTERKNLSRRELLTYVWVGALAAMTAGSGLAAYLFLYPRWPINKFGGKFYLGAAADLPATGSEPQMNAFGKFWLANTEEGLHAFYKICTHPWNGNPHWYTWDPERYRFACPVCGSKFSLEGHYIEGPAPRSLDRFVIEVVKGRKVVGRTMIAENTIVSPRNPSPDAEIVVDTGTMIEGLPSMSSPILKGYRG